MLPVHKIIERVVVDAYFITNIANLVGMNLEIGTHRLILEGKPLHKLECNSNVFEGRAPVLKQALSGDNMRFHVLL